MKKSYQLLIAALASTVCVSASANLIITGVGDPDGGSGDIVELYATADIPDLTIYGVDAASNGASSSAPDFTFSSGSLSAGQFYYLTGDQTDFTQFFGFAADETSLNGINGDDSIYLYQSGTLIDIYGTNPNTDFDTPPLNYADGWAYKNDDVGLDASVGASTATSTLTDWTVTRNSLGNSNDEVNAVDSPNPFPIGTYTLTVVPEPTAALFGSALAGLLGVTVSRRRESVRD